MMATSRFQTTPNFLRVAKSTLKEGKITACFEGDLLMAAVAALHFGVRVLILTGHASQPPTNKVLLDFHPCEGVVAGRSILITKQGDGFNWAYPASTVLADVSPDFGRVCGAFVAALPAMIEDWEDDAGTNMAEVGHPVPSRPLEPRFGCATTFYNGPRPGEDELLHDEHIALLMHEHPRATIAQAKSALLLTKNDRGSTNLIRASNILLNLFSLDDKHGAARAHVDATMNGTQAILSLHHSAANSGKHRSRNKAARDCENDASLSESDDVECMGVTAAGSTELLTTKRQRPLPPAQLSAQDDKEALLHQHAEQQGKASADSRSGGCKPPAAANKRNQDEDGDGNHPPPPPAGNGNARVNAPGAQQESRVNTQLYSAPGEKHQQMEEATAAVMQLANVNYETALAGITHHLNLTNVLEEAAERACADLRQRVTEMPADGVSFVERLLGRGVRPATIKEMAQAHTAAASAQASAMRPVNLSRRWDEHLAHESLAHAHGARARLAHRHLNGDLHDEALQVLKRANQQSECFETPPPPVKSALQAHPNSAVRMAAERETRQAVASHEAPVIVVATNHAKPMLWKQGAEKDSKGFFWSTKLAVQQAWEASNRANGEHAYSTFKSVVHHSMVSVLCFELGISDTQWEKLTDSDLLSRVDALLKPRDSTEYFLKLSTLKMSNNAKDGTLGARYRAFAEPFIDTLAEATASGMAVNAEQAKAAFKTGCCSNHLFKLWLSERKWNDVAAMHQRLARGIRLYEADAVLRALEGSGQSSSNAPAPDVPAPNPSPNSNSQPPPAHQSQKRQQRPWQQQQQEPLQLQRPLLQQQLQPPFQQQQPFYAPPPAPVFVNHSAGTPAHGALVKHPGLDQRGENWHIPSVTLGCSTDPCTRVFCQVCGGHGHSSEECKRKRHAQANHSGYFSINRPNSPRLAFDGYPPTPQQQLQQQQPALQQQPPRPAQHQFAPPPTHYASGGTAQMHLSQSQNGNAAAVNNTAQRSVRFTPIQQQQQQHGTVNHSANQTDAGMQQPPNQQQGRQ
jgi:hypothetical protein